MAISDHGIFNTFSWVPQCKAKEESSVNGSLSLHTFRKGKEVGKYLFAVAKQARDLKTTICQGI